MALQFVFPRTGDQIVAGRRPLSNKVRFLNRLAERRGHAAPCGKTGMGLALVALALVTAVSSHVGAERENARRELARVIREVTGA